MTEEDLESNVMIPGPDAVLGCPRCGALHRCGTLASGNTFGAVLWSDGWFEAPMRPLPPLVARCMGCHAFFWVARAVELGHVDHVTSQCDETLTTLTLMRRSPPSPWRARGRVASRSCSACGATWGWESRR